MKSAFISFFILLIAHSSFAQKCHLIQETFRNYDSLGNRLGGEEASITKYHYDKQGRMDTMFLFYNVDNYWSYKKDTVIMKDYRYNSTITHTYILDKTGKVQKCYETEYRFYINSLGEQTAEVIDSDIVVRSWLYNKEGYCIEHSSRGNKNYLVDGVQKYKWENGNRIIDEFYDDKGLLFQTQEYEYYTDKPFQDLYPSPIRTGTSNKYLIKSLCSRVIGSHFTMCGFYDYEYNSLGLVNKCKETFGNDIRISEYTYDCK